jgi:hypothetical protein
MDRTRVIFDVTYLVDRVECGSYREANMYVLGFLRPDSMSYQAQLLLEFLQSVMVLDEFANGPTGAVIWVCGWFVSIYTVILRLLRTPASPPLFRMCSSSARIMPGLKSPSALYHKLISVFFFKKN